MVIKPWGYATLGEHPAVGSTRMFKATGHENAYFPLFIPMSFLEKEAEHVEGFAKECAVVTHHRLEAGPRRVACGPHPSAKLEEPLIVRPTSETIIGATFARWVQSYRDLPILINQWANVVRWETAHADVPPHGRVPLAGGAHRARHARGGQEETRQDARRLRRLRRATRWRCRSSTGEKTAGERFPGAVATYCIEAMMQDRKALQAGTSHFLGQNFAKAQEIQFQNQAGELQHAWTTSWGVSTRLIGGLIMTHADDDGLVLAADGWRRRTP